VTKARWYRGGVKHDQSCNGRVSRAERARWVARYRASGVGLKRFAAEHGLPPGQLHYWVYAPPPRPATEADAPVFQEVRLTGSMEPPSGWAAEIALANGATVRLREGAAADWAASLVQALGGPCSR
jgi:transposase-like protein